MTSDTPLIQAVVKWRYAIAAALGGGLVALLYGRVPNDWGYVQGGARLLFGGSPDGGLHLYAAHAQLQMGPVTFAIARLVDAAIGTTHALSVLTALGSVLLVPALWFVERSSLGWRGIRPVQPASVIVGFMVTAALWVEMPLFGHLDDSLALVALAAALYGVASGRWTMAGALVGAACAAKPWGIIAVPLLVLAPTWRARLKAAGVAVVIISLTYGPFVLVDHRTLTAVKPTLLVDRLSSLQLFGIGAGSHPWGGLRAVQLVAAVALGLLAVARHRWSAVLLLGVATRLLLDPGSNPYFPAGLAVAALAFDLTTEGRAPWASLLTVAVWLPYFADTAPMFETGLRTTALLSLIVLPMLHRRSDKARHDASLDFNQPLPAA